MYKLTVKDSIYNMLETYKLLQNPKTGLYFQSPRYVYSYLQEEIANGKIA